MRSSLISANMSNEGDRNRQVGGIFYLGRLSMWVPISGREVGISETSSLHHLAASTPGISWSRQQTLPNPRDGVYNRPMFLSGLIDLRIRESPTDAPPFSFRLNLPYSDPLLNPIWTVAATL